MSTFTCAIEIEDPTLTGRRLEETAIWGLDKWLHQKERRRLSYPRITPGEDTVWLECHIDKPIRERIPDAALIEDIEWLLSFGTHPEVIATRLGMRVQTIAKRLSRIGRADLARIFWAEHSRKERR